MNREKELENRVKELEWKLSEVEKKIELAKRLLIELYVEVPKTMDAILDMAKRGSNGK